MKSISSWAGEFKSCNAKTSHAYLVYSYTIILRYIFFFPFLEYCSALYHILHKSHVCCDKQPKPIFHGQTNQNIYQTRLFHHMQDSRNEHIILSCQSCQDSNNAGCIQMHIDLSSYYVIIYNGQNVNFSIKINSSLIATIYFKSTCTLNETLSSFTQFVIVHLPRMPF